jgi:hypothetical protein
MMLQAKIQGQTHRIIERKALPIAGREPYEP